MSFLPVRAALRGQAKRLANSVTKRKISVAGTLCVSNDTPSLWSDYGSRVVER